MIHTFEIRCVRGLQKAHNLVNMLLEDTEIERLHTTGRASYHWHDEYPGLHEIKFQYFGVKFFFV